MQDPDDSINHETTVGAHAVVGMSLIEAGDRWAKRTFAPDAQTAA